MNLTKYSHACLVLEKEGQTLVIDPGNWSSDLVIPHNVVGVVITHAHTDHLDKNLVTQIMEQNPDATIYTHPDVTPELEDFAVQTVTPGETVQAGAFLLSFHGGEHATIHNSMPTIANLGVMVDDVLYYPGDSFSGPSTMNRVQYLALPAAAPWMKISEAMDFLSDLKPVYAFPTHDAILSDAGQQLADALLGGTAKNYGTEYQRIKSGESLPLSS